MAGVFHTSHEAEYRPFLWPIKKKNKKKQEERIMKASKGLVLTVLTGVAVAGVVLLAVACSSGKTDKKAETTAATQAVQETEATIEGTEALEYVTDENWEAMVHTYRIIVDNYEKAKGLVTSGQADPSNIVQRANEIVEFGKICERDNLLNQKAEEVLADMIDTADGMLKLIKAGGREIVETPVANETSQDGQESLESQEDQDGAETAGEEADDSGTVEADSAENTNG